MTENFKPYHIYFGKKYYGLPFNSAKGDIEYNLFLKNLPKKTKGIEFYLNWLDSQK